MSGPVAWSNKESVIAYAIRLGNNLTVFKRPDDVNVFITLTSRTDRYEPEWVVYQT